MSKPSTSSTTRRIAIALSGGVDSSVAAYLLQKNAIRSSAAAADELFGLFMHNWNPLDESSSSSSNATTTLASASASASASRNYCKQSEQDEKDAQSICDKLSIKLHRADFVSEYWMDVFEPFVDEVENGRMLNPDISCNSKIKFGVMKEYAMNRLNATHIATGHYARLWNRCPASTDSSSSSSMTSSLEIPSCVEQGLKLDEVSNDWIETWGSSSFQNGKSSTLHPLLLAAADLEKDQSYFLSSVSGSAFHNVLFPLGDLMKQTKKNNRQSNTNHKTTIPSSSNIESSNYNTKDTPLSVREIAIQANLPTAKKPESMGICFIGKRPFPTFISDYLARTPSPGKFICIDTQTKIGDHDGSALLLTVGQGAKISGASQKWFVCSKDYITSNVYVCQGTHHPALYSNDLIVKMKDWNWIGMEVPPILNQGKSLRALCRIRHLQPLSNCDVIWDKNNSLIRIHFDRPMRGITSGQMAAVYVANGVVCLGGGPIWDRGPSFHQQNKVLPSDLHPSGNNDLSLIHAKNST